MLKYISLVLLTAYIILQGFWGCKSLNNSHSISSLFRLLYTGNVIKLSTRSRSQQLKPGGILFAHLQKIYMSMTKRQIYICLKMRYIVLSLLHV